MPDKVKISLMFVCFWIIFQTAYSSGHYYKSKSQTDRFIASVEKRIALDLPKLKLANPKFSIVAHEDSIKSYLDSVNDELTRLASNVRVRSLQEVQASKDYGDQIIFAELATTDRNVSVSFVILPSSLEDHFSLLAFLLAFVVTLIGRHHVTQEETTELPLQDDSDSEIKPVKLIVNLHNKTISNNVDSVSVALSNKPFCFYAALVDYCLQQDAPKLNHNKEVPEEIIHLANKYFYRLIELGHTKRKRPDFSTNLDKTLSEIRSDLDEVFHDYVDAKDIFYPPKAQGEGSRSKMHNYALEHVDPSQIEIIGK